MAKVMVAVRVFPTDAETDRKALADAIRRVLPPEVVAIRIGEEALAFGYTALRVYVVMPEETEGGTERLEELLRSVEGVGDVEVLSVSRLTEF